MSDQKTGTQAEKKRQAQIEQKRPPAAEPRDQVAEALPDPSIAFKGGTVESQVATMQRLGPIQRHAMLMHISRVQGNAHAQRLLNAMRQGDQVDSSSDAQTARPMPQADIHPIRATTPKLSAKPALPPVQAKLAVSQPEDQYEQEAERVATEVMRMPPAPATPPPPDEGDKGEDKTAAVKRAASQLESQSDGQLQASAEAEANIQRMRGGGHPMPDGERAFFEDRMGMDLSGVRLHTSEQAAQTSQNLQAQAFTVGSDIMFGQGKYQPGTEGGRRLMAHELTHVVQQGGAQRLPAQRLAKINRCASPDCRADRIMLKAEMQQQSAELPAPPSPALPQFKPNRAPSDAPQLEPSKSAKVQPVLPEKDPLQKSLPVPVQAAKQERSDKAGPTRPGKPEKSLAADERLGKSKNGDQDNGGRAAISAEAETQPSDMAQPSHSLAADRPELAAKPALPMAEQDQPSPKAAGPSTPVAHQDASSLDHPARRPAQPEVSSAQPPSPASLSAAEPVADQLGKDRGAELGKKWQRHIEGDHAAGMPAFRNMPLSQAWTSAKQHTAKVEDASKSAAQAKKSALDTVNVPPDRLEAFPAQSPPKPQVVEQPPLPARDKQPQVAPGPASVTPLAAPVEPSPAIESPAGEPPVAKAPTAEQTEIASADQSPAPAEPVAATAPVPEQPGQPPAFVEASTATGPASQPPSAQTGGSQAEPDKQGPATDSLKTQPAPDRQPTGETILVQRDGLLEDLIPSWVKGFLSSLKGDASAKKNDLSSDGSAKSGELKSSSQSKGQEVETNGKLKGGEIKGHGESKGDELKADQESKGSELQADQESKGSELQADQESKGSELQADQESKAAELQSDQESKAAELQSDQENKAAELQSDQEAKGAELQSNQESKSAELASDQEAKNAELQAAQEAKGAELEAESETQSQTIQSQWAQTEQQASQLQAGAAQQVDRVAATLQAQAEAAGTQIEAGFAQLQAEAQTTVQNLDGQANQLCSAFQGKADDYMSKLDPFVQNAQAGWQQLQQDAKSSWDSFMKSAQPTLDAVGQKWQQFTDWAGPNVLEPLKKGISDFANFAGELAGKAWDSAKQMWGKLQYDWNNAEQIISAKADAAREWISGKAEAARDWINGKAEAARDWINGKAEAARDWISGKADAAREWISGKAEAAREWISGKADAAREWIGGKADAAREWIGSKGDAAREWIGGRADAARSWIGDKSTTATSWIQDQASSAQSWISGKANAATNWFRSKAQGLVSGLSSKARSAVSSISSRGGRIMQWFGGIVNSLISGVESVGNAAVSRVSQAMSTGLNWVESKASSAIQTVSTLASSAVNWVGNAATGAVNWVQDKATGAVNWVQDKATGAVSWVEGKALGAVNWVEGKALGAVNWVEGKALGAVNWVEGKALGAVNWVQNKATSAVNWLQDKATSAVNWVEDKALGAVDWVENKALSAVQFARSAWEAIQSGWSAFTEWLGPALQWVGEKASWLGSQINEKIIQPATQFIQEKWSAIQDYVAENFPGLVACWDTLKEFAGAAWEKFQELPLVKEVTTAVGEIIQGAILGDFMENPSIWNIVGQVIVGFIPGVGQVADVRDLLAAITKVVQGQEGAWLDLSMALVGFIPGLGDAAKAGKHLDNVDEVVDAVSTVSKNLDEVLPYTDEILGPVVKHGDEGIDAVGTAVTKYGDEVVDAVVEGGDEAVETIIKHGDEGAEALIKNADEAAGAGKHADEAADAGKHADDVPGGKAPDTPGGKAPDTPGGKAPDTPGGKAPDTPGGKVPDTKPQSAGAQMAKNQGYPDAPDGYHWAKQGDGVTLKRNPGKASDPAFPQMRYDPETGTFVKADAPLPAGTQIAISKGYPPAPPGYHWAKQDNDVIIKRNPGNASDANYPPLQYFPGSGRFLTKDQATLIGNADAQLQQDFSQWLQSSARLDPNSNVFFNPQTSFKPGRYGYYSPTTKQLYINKDMNGWTETTLHEGLHMLSDNGLAVRPDGSSILLLGIADGHYSPGGVFLGYDHLGLNEGFTELMALETAGRMGVTNFTPAYLDEIGVAQALRAKVGSDTVTQAYFASDTDGLRQATDAVLGAGAFDEISARLNVGDAPGATAIINNGMPKTP